MNSGLPHIVVASVVEREGRFLIVEEEIDGQLWLNQPAGHWEPGETLVQGAVREALEESAWDVEPTHLVGIYEWQPETLPYPFFRITFAARALRHHPDRALDHGIVRALWLDRAELAAQGSRLRSPAVLRSIDDWAAGERYPLSMIRHL
jgi:8-oxo-dGTP pyrophosphatase MutT (NUDIX family)